MSRKRKDGIKLPTQADLHSLLSYNASTGKFTWKVDRGAGLKAGNPAGTQAKSGYVHISVFGRLYRAHRLAWLFCFGKWPEGELDHKNGVANDNRIANLRECSHSENHQNVGKRRHNTSGFVGVTLSPYGTWKARLVVNGKKINLGAFPTPEEAASAYLKAKAEYHTFQPAPRCEVANG
jgi:hypothetical protein